jgi:hypothetical protein
LPFEAVNEITRAQVHRHNSRVAVWIENQPTVYLTVGQAKGLAAALKACAKDISENSVTASKFQTFRIEP